MSILQSEENLEESANVVAQYLLEHNVSQIFEHSQRLEGLKIKIDETIPTEIAHAIRISSRESITRFKWTKSRIRLLPFSLLPSTTVLKLKNLLVNVDDLVQEILVDKSENFKEYGEEFYKFANEKLSSWHTMADYPHPESGTGVYIY